MARPKIITIEWHDPTSTWGWKKVSAVADGQIGAALVTSVGMYVGEDDTNFYIAQDWSEDECNTQGIIRKDLVERYSIRPLPRGFGKGQVGPED